MTVATREGIVAMELPGWLAAALNEYFRAFSVGLGDTVTNAVEEVTGHLARSYDIIMDAQIPETKTVWLAESLNSQGFYRLLRVLTRRDWHLRGHPVHLGLSPRVTLTVRFWSPL